MNPMISSKVITALLLLSVAVALAAPSVPLGLAMVANSPDSIRLAWYRPPTDDAKAYNVYASDKADGVFTKVSTVTERTATHTKLAAGKTYFYKVSATNADGESAQTPA